MPDAIEQVEPFDQTTQIYPWADEVESVSLQKSLAEPLPSFNVVERAPRKMTLKVKSARKGMEIGFVFPGNSNLVAYSIGGNTYDIEPMKFGSWPGNFVIGLKGLYGEEAQITFHTDSAEPLRGWMYDIKRGLPSGYNHLLEARTPLAIEVHDGDRSLLYKKVHF